MAPRLPAILNANGAGRPRPRGGLLRLLVGVLVAVMAQFSLPSRATSYAAALDLHISTAVGLVPSHRAGTLSLAIDGSFSHPYNRDLGIRWTLEAGTPNSDASAYGLFAGGFLDVEFGDFFLAGLRPYVGVGERRALPRQQGASDSRGEALRIGIEPMTVIRHAPTWAIPAYFYLEGLVGTPGFGFRKEGPRHIEIRGGLRLHVPGLWGYDRLELLATDSRQRGKLRDAAHLYRALVQGRPQEVRHHVWLMETYARLGEPSKVSHAYEEFARVLPDAKDSHARALRVVGDVYRHGSLGGGDPYVCRSPGS